MVLQGKFRKEAFVRKDVIDQLVYDLDRTLNLAEFTRLVGTSKGSMRHYISTGVVKTVEVLGRERVLKSCFESCKEFLEGKHDRKVASAKNGGKACAEKWQKIREVRGTRRLLTQAKAAKYLGIRIAQLQDLVARGLIMPFLHESPYLVFRSSVKAYKNRPRIRLYRKG
ncbi:MAG: hypothetical protein WCK91_03470 [bacterium]